RHLGLKVMLARQEPRYTVALLRNDHGLLPDSVKHNAMPFEVSMIISVDVQNDLGPLLYTSYCFRRHDRSWTRKKGRISTREIQEGMIFREAGGMTCEKRLASGRVRADESNI